MPDYAIETLGDLKRHNMGLAAHCGRPGAVCGHHGDIDLDALITKLGEDHVIINDKVIGPKMACRACGYRGATIMIVADTRPAAFRGR